MTPHSLSHLSDRALDQDLQALVAQDRATTADLLAHIGEFRARKLHLRAGYSSMHAYCVEKLRLSSDAAYKRVQAAGIARRFPQVYEAISYGRLHLSGICLLAPYLTPENGGELLRSAEGMTKSGIERLIAHRFPRTELLPLVEALPTLMTPPSVGSSPAVAHPEGSEPTPASSEFNVSSDKTAPGQFSELPAWPGQPGEASQQGDGRKKLSETKPIALRRFSLHLTMGQQTHDKLRYAQQLLSHQLAAGDIAGVVDKALDALIGQLEKQKFAATDRPRAAQARHLRARAIPAEVKRAVWKRDGGRCTYVSDSGHRCRARKRLEFDHVDPVARGGKATVDTVRLLCRAHNQYAADQAFGKEFMEARRKPRRPNGAPGPT